MKKPEYILEEDAIAELEELAEEFRIKYGCHVDEKTGIINSVHFHHEISGLVNIRDLGLDVKKLKGGKVTEIDLNNIRDRVFKIFEGDTHYGFKEIEGQHIGIEELNEDSQHQFA